MAPRVLAVAPRRLASIRTAISDGWGIAIDACPAMVNAAGSTAETGLPPMPNAPRPDNVAHTVRVPDDLWQRARERATEKGETVSEAVRRFLERYTR